MYQKFLDILHQYQKSKHTAVEVFQQVQNLFGEENEDMLDEFTYFLPGSVKNKTTHKLHVNDQEKRGGKVVNFPVFHVQTLQFSYCQPRTYTKNLIKKS